MKKLKPLGTLLSKQEMKKIVGGVDYSWCASSETVCWEDGSTKYYCFIINEGEPSMECCCGADAGNANCEAG